MKVVKVGIKNFRPLKDVELCFESDTTVIVGFKSEPLTILENLERNAGDVEYQRDLLPLLARSRQHLKERTGPSNIG